MAAAEVAASDSILPLLPPPPPPRSSSSRSPPRVHVIVTSNGSPYLNYQTRLLFASWQRVKEREARGEFSSSSSSSASTSSPTTPTTATMAGFTRILHRTRDDALVREVPTLRVAPRTPSCDGWCGFPVADRPEAVRSFFAAVRRSCVGKTREKIPGMEEDEERVGSLLFFLAETDYVFLRPVPVPRNLFSSSSSASSSSPRDHHQLFDGVAFPFGYIQPRSDVVAPILERLFFSALLRPPPRGGEGGGGGENENKERKRKNSAADDDGASSSPSSPLAVPNTGPSPVLLPLSSWLRLLPAWVSFTEAIEKDLEAREVLGWIREMVREVFFSFFLPFFMSKNLSHSFPSLSDFFPSEFALLSNNSTPSPRPRPSRASSSTSFPLLLLLLLLLLPLFLRHPMERARRAAAAAKKRKGGIL